MSAESIGEVLAAELAAEGFPRVPARILLRLMVAPAGALTAAELSAALELSPAAVSGGIRYLDVLGFIRIDVLPGSRRHVYRLPPQPWYASTLTQDRYSGVRDLIDSGLRDVEEGPARDRLADMRDFFGFLQTEMPLLWDRWRASRG